MPFFSGKAKEEQGTTKEKPMAVDALGSNDDQVTARAKKQELLKDYVTIIERVCAHSSLPRMCSYYGPHFELPA
jgi:hypothetical protein